MTAMFLGSFSKYQTGQTAAFISVSFVVWVYFLTSWLVGCLDKSCNELYLAFLGSALETFLHLQMPSIFNAHQLVVVVVQLQCRTPLDPSIIGTGAELFSFIYISYYYVHLPAVLSWISIDFIRDVSLTVFLDPDKSSKNATRSHSLPGVVSSRFAMNAASSSALRAAFYCTRTSAVRTRQKLRK